MKKLLKALTLVAALSGCALFSGCITDGRDVYGATTANYAGILTINERDFTQVAPTTARIRSSELGVREYLTGHRATFLWGLVTYTDY